MEGDKTYPERNYEVGKLLLGLRTRAKLTQAQLAQLVNVSKRSIEKWENGEVYPAEERVRNLLQVLLNEGAFLTGKELEEARTFWQQVSQAAPRRLSPFDESWFSELLSIRQVKLSSFLSAASSQPALSPDPSEQPILGVPTGLALNLKETDWGEAISVRNFFGRQSELNELESWITTTACRLVALLGMGGIGKTSLSIRLGQQLNPHFDFIFWRSLRSAPPFNEILGAALRFLSGQTLTSPPTSPNEGVTQLINLLRQRRCLLILDNLETLLQEETDAGSYRAGYADYGLLIRRVAESEHQSCLVLTSREKPRELGALEGFDSPIRTLRLAGLAQNIFQEILADRGLVGLPDEWARLTERYGGNPLALKLVSETVRETFGGNIKTFLATDTLAFGDVGYLLDSQFERLTELERDLMFWLAIEREPVGLATLESNLNGVSASRRNLIEALESLRRRNLIERSDNRNDFTQQPVVMEYVTERLVERIRTELLSYQVATSESPPPRYLASYALLKAQAKDYIRQSQKRLLVQPLLTRLEGPQHETARVENYLRQTLDRVRKLPSDQQGYAVGNILNLLVSLGQDLQGWDFSGLKIWQAYLAGVELHNINMAGADLSRSIFTEAFSSILTLAYSPDGQFLAGGSLAGDIKIWQFQDQAEDNGYSLFLECQGHTDIVSSVAYSPDGRFLVSGSYDRTVRLWDAQSGENLLTLTGHTDTVRTVAFSPDGRLVASGSFDNTVRLWRVATGELLATLEGHTGWVWSVAFSPDGRLLASGSFDTTVRLWELDLPQSSPKPIATLSGHQGWVLGIVFSPDGQTFWSGSADTTIRRWSVVSHEQLQILEGNVGTVQALAISVDGMMIASGGDDRTIRLWQAGSEKPYLTLSGHAASVAALAFSSNNETLASSSSDRSVRLWSTQRGEGLTTLQGYTNLVWSVVISLDGAYLAGTGSNNRVLAWQLTSWGLQSPRQVTPSIVLKGHTNQILTLAFSLQKGWLASAGQDTAIKLWDLDKIGGNSHINPRLTLVGHTNSVNTLTFNPAGTVLASGCSDGTIKLWSTINGELISNLQGHEGIVWAIGFNPTATVVASGGNDGTVRLWDVQNGQLLTSLGSDKIPVASLAYSVSGDIIACAMYDGTIRLWQTLTNDPSPIILKGHRGTVWSVAFNPNPANSAVLLSGGNDGTVRLWNTENGQEIAHFQHAGFVRSVAFTPDGTGAISAGDGGLIRLWDIASGQLVTTYRDFQPYEGVNIAEATGLTAAQRATLLALGAVEN